ncbi:scaffold/adaptor protein [Lithospermum erythrorhizon]|uniref:Scaffold/adaptor protein n=1 Tax=Lithospermum erythrorhizon TaxID=34254 RepID=A0AAV3RDQ3_LITER
MSPSGSDTFTHHLHNNEDGDANIHTYKILHSGSPVSPLYKTRPNQLTTTTRSSTSSGSGPNIGLVTGPQHSNDHSGELSGSADSPFTGFGPAYGAGLVSWSGPNCGLGSGSGSGSGLVSGSNTNGGLSSGSGSGGISSTGSVCGGGSIRSGHARSGSTGTPNAVGNICPTGRGLKLGMTMPCRSTRSDVLGSGGVNYGHGSIIGSNNNIVKQSSKCNDDDPEELKRLGNESYMKGNYAEALGLYNKAIAISPGNATLHCNKAVSLIGLKNLPQALKECKEAVRLDPGYQRARRRLGSLFLSLGLVENARKHLTVPGMQVDPIEMQKLQTVEMHILKCSNARRIHDWESILREIDAAVASGADSSPQLFACRAEALLNLHRLDDASLSLSNVTKFEAPTAPYSQLKFLGMLCEAYLLVVRAQIELAHGRFDNAVTAAEKAAETDPRNREVSVLLKNMRLVARAHSRGNDLFKSERFTEACSAYGEGLKIYPSNSILYCNRAACWYKLGSWETSVDDCDQARQIQANYSKALLRRAASYSKLERWAEAVTDYDVLKKEIPYDNEIAEKWSLVLLLEQFRAAVSSPIATVVHFKEASDTKCKQVSQFLFTLCSRYPSMSFLKVDVNESQAIANSENIKIVPTVKIYRSGNRVKEMVCPSPEALESSVRHYSV